MTTISARATASTLAPTRIENRTNACDTKSIELPPRPDENRARFAPKTITWNDITVLIKCFEYDIEPIPMKMRTVAVTRKMVCSDGSIAVNLVNSSLSTIDLPLQALKTQKP